MKKILILLMPLFLILPLSSVFATSAELDILESRGLDLSNGLLDDGDNIKFTNFKPVWYDNNLDNYSSLANNTTYYTEFKEQVDINTLLIKTANGGTASSLNIYFLDDDKVRLESINFSGNQMYLRNVDIKNVIRIEIDKSRTFTFHIFEIEFFGIKSSDQLPPPDIREVLNVEIEAEPNRINLSWDLPETEHLEHVNIYRKDLEESVQETSMLDFLKPMKVHASNDDFRAIFETNGTYFNDLTVVENSKYEYKLTTEFQGIESQGVIVQAETGISPAPPLEGGGGEQQTNGDYLFKWSSPREGQVRVFVDGNEYATVEASTGQLLVPGSDMKYSSLGKPLISYQTIGLNGEESNITSPDVGDLESPVTAGEVIETGSDLLMLIAPYLMVALSIPLAIRLIKILRISFDKDEREKRYYRFVNRKWEKEQKKEQRKENREVQRDIRTMTRQPRRGRRA